jgi:hypothetical protein
MHTETEALLPVYEAFADTPDTTASIEAAANEDIARSEENILQWMSYLPADCVQTMILMGWDIST